MRWGGRTRIALAVVVASLTLASAASAAGYVYTASTPHSGTLTLTADGQGRIVRLAYGWLEPCRQRGVAFRNSGNGYFKPPARRRFTAPVPIKGHQGSDRFTGSGTIRGHQVSTGMWRGTISASVRIYRNGVVIDRCALQVAWRAVAPVATLTMHSDVNDFLGNGLDYRYTTPTSPISVTAGRNEIEIALGGWNVWINVPRGHSLHAGSYTNAARASFAGNHPGLDVFGDGRGCNTVRGSFTIAHLLFGAHGTLQRLDVSFVDHCEGQSPALHGRLTYQLG